MALTQKEKNQKYYEAHKEQEKKRSRDAYAANPEYYKNASREAYRADHEIFERRQLKRNHGITPEQKYGLLESQGCVCAACGATEPGGQTKSWHLDHDHITGFFRGVLCNNCNIALGYLKDSVERILALADYMTRKPDYEFEVL